MIPELKRLKAMYVYEILSKEGKELSRAEINGILWDKYRIKETPKTLKKLLDDMVYAELIEVGEIKERTTKKKDENGNWIEEDTSMNMGYYAENEFADDELLWLIHNTIFSKQLTESKSNKLVKKLLKLGTKELSSKVGSVEGMKQFYHTPNPAVSYNIETLSSAIYEDKTVKFIYTEYKLDKQLHPMCDEPIIVKPARMVPLNGFYYLIAYEIESGTIQHYRIDKIKNLEFANIKTDFSAKNSRINIDEYLASHSFMFSGNPVSVKIKIPEDKIGLVIDRFGDKIHIYRDNNDYVSIGFNSNESDLYAWALENGEYVEVIEPQRIRNRIRETVQAMSRCYLKSNEDRYFDAIQYAQKCSQFFCEDYNFANRDEWLQLTDIDSLELENNGFTDISILKRFKELVFLDIKNEHITDISVVNELSLLNHLSLKNTDVKDISCLRGRGISFIKLINNKNIIDYSPLYDIENLRLLTIDGMTAEKIDTEKLINKFDPLEIVIEYPNGERKHLFSAALSDENYYG